jgi:hypothetical protein
VNIFNIMIFNDPEDAIPFVQITEKMITFSIIVFVAGKGTEGMEELTRSTRSSWDYSSQLSQNE